MSEESPVLDTLTDITAVSLEKCKLDPREFMMARIAALVAVDASAASYLMNTPGAVDAGITLEDVQGVLIAVTPVVGTPRVLTAATRIAEALGFAIRVLEAEAQEDIAADGMLAGVSKLSASIASRRRAIASGSLVAVAAAQADFMYLRRAAIDWNDPLLNPRSKASCDWPCSWGCNRGYRRRAMGLTR